MVGVTLNFLGLLECLISRRSMILQFFDRETSTEL